MQARVAHGEGHRPVKAIALHEERRLVIGDEERLRPVATKREFVLARDIDTEKVPLWPRAQKAFAVATAGTAESTLMMNLAKVGPSRRRRKCNDPPPSGE